VGVFGAVLRWMVEPLPLMVMLLSIAGSPLGPYQFWSSTLACESSGWVST
jgi:hypothetical protein